MSPNERKPTIILGAGGFAREAHTWAIHSNIPIVGFYDENSDGETTLHHIPVTSCLTMFKGCEFFVGVGDPQTKKKLWAQALGAGLTPAFPLIHPSAIVGMGVQIGFGVIICPKVVVTTDAYVRNGVMLNLGVTVGHNCEIAEFVTVSPGANISGGVTVGMGAYIGTNATIREKVKIGEGATVGMGAVVLKDVPAQTTMIGNPARRLELK